MKFVLRSGALDRLRAAVKDQFALIEKVGDIDSIPAAVLGAHPNVSAVFRLPFGPNTREDAEVQLALMLMMLGNSRDRLLVATGPLRIKIDFFVFLFCPYQGRYALPDPSKTERIPGFINVWLRFTSAFRYSPNPGPAVLDTWKPSTHLAPVILALERAAEALCSSPVAGHSLLVIGDAVHALHGVVSKAAQEAADREAKALEEQAAVSAEMAAKRRIQERRLFKPRWEQLEGTIKDLELRKTALFGWRDRLHAVGLRILREHLPTMEGKGGTAGSEEAQVTQVAGGAGG